MAFDRLVLEKRYRAWDNWFQQSLFLDSCPSTRERAFLLVKYLQSLNSC